MKFSLRFLFPVALFVGCGQHGNAPQNGIDTLAPKTADSQAIAMPADTTTNTIAGVSDTILLHLSMDTAGQHIVLPVRVLAGKKLFAILSAKDSMANIRFSQIEMPDSTFDGPFGKKLDYDIRTRGRYKLIIGEDMMAAGRWKGPFSVKIFVQ